MIEPVFTTVFRSSIFNTVFPTTGPAAPTSPVDLFSSGAQGLWYDPTDLTTMFQDSAGTIPVTAPGQPVGRRVDLSGRSNNSTQTIANSRLTYGIEPKTGTRNLFQRTEEFNVVAWVKISTTVTADSVVAPNGTTTADTITAVAATSGHYTGQIISTVLSATVYTVSVYARAGTNNFIQIARDGDAQNYANFDLSSGSVGTVGTKTTAPAPVSVGGGWYRCSATFDSTSTSGTGHRFYIVNSSTAAFAQSWAAAGTETVYLWGAQLELGGTATAYQKVVTAFEVTEAGVDSCHYCQYDGTDDSMATPAINFTGADAMSVFLGVYKRTDAALGTVLELSVDAVNNNGAFALRAPNTTASAAYSYLSRGTALALATTPTTFPAPRHNVLTGLSDISADQSVARVNGVQVVSSASDQGTGAYGNYALFSGRRNNTNLPFAGRDYGMLVVGKNASPAEISFMEAWFAARTPTVTI